MQHTPFLLGLIAFMAFGAQWALPHPQAQVLAQAIAFVSLGALLFSLLLARRSQSEPDVVATLTASHDKLMKELATLKSQAHAQPAPSHSDELNVLKTIIAELSQAKENDPQPLQDITIHAGEEEEVIDTTSEGELILFHDIDDKKEETFSSLDRLELVEMVKEALKKDRVDVLLQPIVSLPQRKPRFYECFSRLRTADGSILVPDAFLETAEGEGLMGAVDNALLFKCIQLVRRARKRGADIKFFCNISGASLADETFIKSFVDFIEINKELKPWIFFEIKEDVMLSHDPRIQEGLQKLSAIKCRFSLDQMTCLDMDTKILTRLGVKFVKLHNSALVCDEEEFKRLQSLRQKLESLRIDVIATKLETEAELKNILDFNVDYGQGYLFSPPQICRL